MLTKLFEQERVPGQDTSLDIIVIPAFGLSRPSEWLNHDGSSWLLKLVEDVVPGANVWEYAYSSRQEGSIAQRLIEEGPVLLETLLNHPSQNQDKKLPLVFICHGLGAFVLKSALCICRSHHLRYRSVIDVFSGMIFLGAPHFVKSKQDARRTFDLLLKCQNKGTGRSLSNDNDLKVLIDTCTTFELVHLNVPILSAYETMETSTQYSLFSRFRGRGKGQVVIPEAVGTLRLPIERAVECQSDHFNICKIPIDSGVYKAAKEFLSDILQNAPIRISEAREPYNIPSAFKNDTLRSPSSAGYTVFVQEGDSIPVSYPPGGATGGSTLGSFEFVPAETATESVIRDPILPCFSLGAHERMQKFIGRKEILNIIDDHLNPIPLQPDEEDEAEQSPFSHASDSISEGEEQLRSFAICGLGGMGKTELAVEYAYSRRSQFEAIFWLGADDSKLLASNFAQIAQKLGLEDEFSDLAASRDVAMAWLSRPLRKISEPDIPENNVKWLIIFDNVDNLDVLADFWPKFGRGSVLVTSRDPFVKHNLYMKSGMNLPPLSNSESEYLMQKLTYLRADGAQKNALSAITHKLGGLPLAINQMSGVFRRLRLSYTEFLNLYDDEGIESLFSRQMQLNGSQRVRSLATVWALDQLSPGTKALLQVICLLDPDDIPEDLLVDKSCEVDLPHYPKSRGDYYDRRSELVSSSLIAQNEDQRKISLHRLIQDTVKATMKQTELIVAYQAAARLIISSWPFQSMKEHHSIARFKKCEEIFPSVLRLKNGLESLLKESTDFPLDIRVARLFNDTGWYMFERGLPEETKTFCDFGLFIGEKLKYSLGAAAIESIRESHEFLGIALVETNEHILSKVHKEKWLEMLHDKRLTTSSSLDDYELGYAYNEIGVAYGNLEMLDEAAEAFIKSINIFQSLNDYEDTMLGWPEPNLGFIYWMQGDLDGAEKALVEILDIHAAAWGIDDTKSFKTGKILYGMGNVLEAQGRFEESLNFHNRCFEQFKKVLGTNHHRVGDICHKLAGHCMRQDRYTEAETFLNSALKIFESRPYLINERSRSTFRKGKLFQLMGRHSEADELLLEAHALRKQLEPRDTRPPEQLEEVDFDRLVAFWSR